MRRRDFAIGLLLAAVTQPVRAQEPAKQHRIAIVISAGPTASITPTGVRPWQAFFSELHRLGDTEGESLTVERYSGEGRPDSYADLAREVVARHPDVIVAITDEMARTVRAATDTIPIVWNGGDPIRAGFAKSLAPPGRQHHRRHRFRGARDLGEALADPQGSRPFGIASLVSDHAHVCW